MMWNAVGLVAGFGHPVVVASALRSAAHCAEQRDVDVGTALRGRQDMLFLLCFAHYVQ